MDTFPSTLKQVKSSGDGKYDVVYMNTPWNRLTLAQMSKMAIKDLTNENSLLYIWADSFTMADTIELINKFEYKFESVYQVCDVATYPPPTPPKSRSKAVKVDMNDAMDVVKTPDEKPVESTGGDGTTTAERTETEAPIIETNTTSDTTPGTTPDVVKKTPLKRVKKLRCPPLTTPKYWTSTSRGTSRGTTEYLLLAYRGDASVFTELSNEKSGTLPFQVITKPELGKKSRSVPKKNIYIDPEWNVDRPDEFMETVISHLKPGTRVLELFGSTIRDGVDGLGPNLPGGFVPSYTSNMGVTGALCKVLRTMRKVKLQALVSSLSKMGQADDNAVRVEEFKKIADTFVPLKKALVDMKTDVSYDWSSDEGDICEWLRLLVLDLAGKTVNNFSNLRRKKKRRNNGAGSSELYGIAKKRPVDIKLTDFLGLPEGTEVARTTAVKEINRYIKEQKLQNPEKKVEILLDDKLKTLLCPPEGFECTYFKICSLLSPLFPMSIKKKAELEKAEREKAAGGASSEVNVIEDTTVENEPNKKQRVA